MNVTDCDPSTANLTAQVGLVDHDHSERMRGSTLSFANLQALEGEIAYSVFVLAVAADLASYGISGDANSRWLSFLDSFSHSSSWAVDEPELPLRARIFGAILSKYGSGLVVSMLLGVTPGFMQTNTSIAFAIALLLAHTNTHLARLARSRQGPWRALFVAMNALYKSRKVRFAVSKCNNLPQALLLGTLSIELTGWLVVASRSYVKHERPLEATVAFIYENRLRLFFSLAAVFAVYFAFHATILILLLGLHKASRPDDGGRRIHFEFW